LLQNALCTHAGGHRAAHFRRAPTADQSVPPHLPHTLPLSHRHNRTHRDCIALTACKQRVLPQRAPHRDLRANRFRHADVGNSCSLCITALQLMQPVVLPFDVCFVHQPHQRTSPRLLRQPLATKMRQKRHCTRNQVSQERAHTFAQPPQPCSKEQHNIRLRSHLTEVIALGFQGSSVHRHATVTVRPSRESCCHGECGAAGGCRAAAPPAHTRAKGTVQQYISAAVAAASPCSCASFTPAGVRRCRSSVRPCWTLPIDRS
jgi:hypothetical protein